MLVVLMNAPGPRMRLGAYAFAVADRAILLTQLADTEPEPGSWTLPGGGVAWGEHPIDALHREVYEETGLDGEVKGLLGINSHVFDRHHSPELPPLHAVRLVYRMALDGAPHVVEEGGTTQDAAWHDLDSLDALDVVELVTWALDHA